jgi:hypothetical protein
LDFASNQRFAGNQPDTRLKNPISN